MPDTDDQHEGRRLVVAAREQWVQRLIDNSRNNTLLFYRELKVGTLDLTDRIESVDALLHWKEVGLETLLPPESGGTGRSGRGDYEWGDSSERQRLNRRLVAIQRKAKENEEEKGLETLVLALGSASWPAGDGGRPYDAPVLLVPMRIRSRGKAGEDLRLKACGDPKANLVLLYLLEKEFGIKVSPDSLLKVATTEGEGDDWIVEPTAAYRELARGASKLSGLRVSERAVLGNFAFARMAMVEDLLRSGDALADSCLIRALAGHATSRTALQAERVSVDPRELDRLSPDDEHIILDADSSQQRAISMVALGQDGVIHGPPGTGKSQTIANLIAELAAQQKRVLFVAEKRAALEAVLKRLRGVGLGHLALDLHGATVSRKEVMARVKDALDKVRDSPPVDCSDLHASFTDRRRTLNEHARRMNVSRPPTGLSVHHVQGDLMRLPPEARTEVRWRRPALDELTQERARRIRGALADAASLSTLFLGTDPSPWNNAAVRDGKTAQETVDLVAELAGVVWPRFESTLAALVKEASLDSVGSLETCKELARLTQEIEQLLTTYSEGVFKTRPADLATALDAASRGTAAIAWAFVTDGRFRAARRAMQGMRRQPTASKTLLAEARTASTVDRRWQRLAGRGSAPAAFRTAVAFRVSLEAVQKALRSLSGVLDWKHVGSGSLSDIGELLSVLKRDSATPYKLPRVHDLRNQLGATGMSALVDDIRQRCMEPPLWTKCFDHAWFSSALDQAMADEPNLATFNGRAHEAHVSQFARLDLERVDVAASRVRRLHAEGAIGAMNAHPRQADIVRREANKRARHLPLRTLLSEAPDVLTRVAPCWVASPLSVSQLLAGGTRHFDVVVFDEASQILPEEAVPALYRAGQAVVAGDRHQLPPTTFFAANLDDGDDAQDEADDATAGFESLLDSTSAFLPAWPLDWHYRSDDERLIAFSNHHIYDNRLVTFPSAGMDDVVKHVLVGSDPGLAGQEVSSSLEVDAVVRLVMEHVATRPHESLGVIAMGIRHANRIQAALDRELYLHADDFFDTEKEERFFVKNLENVQGDERDAIILSVGYGKTSDGDLPHRFGPLTHGVGHRRLNVAVTRARRRLTLVSSFAHHEVDLDRSRSRGVKLLKAYLEYAASGGARLPRTENGDPAPENAFEIDIKDALEARGIKVRAQYGASRYRIDLVAMHPTNGDRPVLAIECDGASYHRSATARDRDRLRQEQLMRLGWRFLRIWSTDWFTQREAEIERTAAAYKEAVAEVDAEDAANSGAIGVMQARPEGEAEHPSARRGSCPLPQRGSIDRYNDAELRKLAVWVRSDGRLRTDEEILREMQESLGLKRLGSRVRERLERAVAVTRTPA